jgi:ankyrin repeat protein
MSVQVVEYLLSLKVDLDKQDKEGATPLHKSAYMGDNDVLKLLVDKGAIVNSVVLTIKIVCRTISCHDFFFFFFFLVLCILG